MHAFLITGNSDTLRKQKIEELLKNWQVSPFDRIELVRERNSIGIADIREFQSRITLKPYNSPLTAAIVNEAHLLTIEAQQALLKTLEEPPPSVRIILETSTPDMLLPTILSRCQILKIKETIQEPSDDLFQCFKTLKQLTESLMGEKLKIIEKIAVNKEDALNWIDLALTAGREAMLENKISPKILRGLLTARVQILTNVNPKLSLDNLFLSL